MCTSHHLAVPTYAAIYASASCVTHPHLAWYSTRGGLAVGHAMPVGRRHRRSHRTVAYRWCCLRGRSSLRHTGLHTVGTTARPPHLHIKWEKARVRYRRERERGAWSEVGQTGQTQASNSQDGENGIEIVVRYWNVRVGRDNIPKRPVGHLCMTPSWQKWPGRQGRWLPRGPIEASAAAALRV
jgi:hypothetical protein